jgi:hypothetical protein
MIFERLRESFIFWWRNLGAIALVTIPFSLISSAIVLALGAPLTRQADDTLALNGVTLALIFVVRTLAEGTLIAQLAAISGGRPRSFVECAAFALTITPALLLCNLVILSGASLGLLAFILPGAWIYVRLSLAPFLVALERASVGDALKSSLGRTREIQWELLAGWLLLLVSVISISNIVGALLIGAGGDHAGTSIVLDMFTALGGGLLHVLLFRYYGLSKSGQTPANPNA